MNKDLSLNKAIFDFGLMLVMPLDIKFEHQLLVKVNRSNFKGNYLMDPKQSYVFKTVGDNWPVIDFYIKLTTDGSIFLNSDCHPYFWKDVDGQVYLKELLDRITNIRGSVIDDLTPTLERIGVSSTNLVSTLSSYLEDLYSTTSISSNFLNTKDQPYFDWITSSLKKY